jgi:hypothetical protein
MSRFIRVSLAVALAVLVDGSGWAQEKVDPREIAKMGAPGPEHEKLRALFGNETWFFRLELEGGNTDAKLGTAVYKSILGGRFVTEEVKLPFGGITFEWFGIYGYDKRKKKYTAVWVDNFDTTTESGEGDIDSTGKIITFKGEHLDPRTGKPAAFKWRIERLDDTTLSITMYESDAAGKEKLALCVKGTKTK